MSLKYKQTNKQTNKEVGVGALDKVELGEETKPKTPGLGQWLMFSPLPLSNASTQEFS